MSDIAQTIDDKIGEVRFDSIDLSLGEIVSLHQNGELIIQPEYQRLFRWTTDQRSRIVESILLELPIPQIFTIENETGVLELIDGLQRVSSIIQFIDPAKIDQEALVLTGCDLVPELNGQTFESLPLKLRLQLKRSSIRTIIIKRQSQAFLRYEMFKRLNTGGSGLSNQEIRNCSSRVAGEPGRIFCEFIQNLAKSSDFTSVTSTLSSSDMEQRGDEELVLRFFALKNDMSSYRGSVRDWLDSYMEPVIFQKVQFDFSHEEEVFKRVFGLLSSSIGDGAFVKWRRGSPIGSLAPAYFEAVSAAVCLAIDHLEGKDPNQIKGVISNVLESNSFKNFTGPGANSRPKLEGRINEVKTQLLAIE